MNTPPPTYRLGLNQPVGSPTERRIAAMAAAINKDAGGAFRLQAHPEGRLGLDPQMFADMRAGKLEFYLSGALLGDVAPTSALPLLPFAFKTEEAVFAALDGALGDKIRAELATHGIHAFRRAWQNGFHHLTTASRPIRDAGDFAGLKIRTPGGAIAADFFRALGAAPGMVPFNRMYEALKAGQFDGQSDPLQVVLALKLYEVQRYLSLTGHWWSGFTLLANADRWNALPAAIRDIIERRAAEFALQQRAEVHAVNAAGAQELEARGLVVNEADTGSIRARLGDLYRRWQDTAGPETWRLLLAHADGLGS